MTGSRKSVVVRKSYLTNLQSLALKLGTSDGKEAKVIIQQTAADVDQVKRLSSNLISAD